MMTTNEKKELKSADYEAKEVKSRIWEDYLPQRTTLERIRDQNFKGNVRSN